MLLRVTAGTQGCKDLPAPSFTAIYRKKPLSRIRIRPIFNLLKTDVLNCGGTPFLSSEIMVGVPLPARAVKAFPPRSIPVPAFR